MAGCFMTGLALLDWNAHWLHNGTELNVACVAGTAVCSNRNTFSRPWMCIAAKSLQNHPVIPHFLPFLLIMKLVITGQ